MKQQKILVALTPAAAEPVFSEALSLAQANHASLKLLHILSLDEVGSPNIMVLLNSPEHRQQWQDYERPGLDLLRTFQQKALAAGVNTEFAQVVGKPGQTICEIAQSWDADLIILGRRGNSGLGELIMGSVSNYVVHYAPCSVLVVQGKVTANSEVVPQQPIAASV